jgi:hypothetical protein
MSSDHQPQRPFPAAAVLDDLFFSEIRLLL